MGSVNRWSGPATRMGPSDPAAGGGGVLDCEGVVEGNHTPLEAVAERDEALDAGEVYIRFGDGQLVCLVELVDAVIRNGIGDEGSHEVRTTSFSSLQLARSGLPQYRSFR